MNIIESMKTRGRTAWLITWEGSDLERIEKPFTKCKVVALLRAQLGEDSIEIFLRTLYSSESNSTLEEKLFLGTANKDNLPHFFKKAFVGEYAGYYCGSYMKKYLYARKVKDLECVSSNGKETLSWP